MAQKPTGASERPLEPVNVDGKGNQVKIFLHSSLPQRFSAQIYEPFSLLDFKPADTAIFLLTDLRMIFNIHPFY
jgi:hypothetical protein